MRMLATSAALALTLGLAVAASASASATRYHATFVEVGGAIAGGSCGSATISGAGHVAYQCVYFNSCGPNCDGRTITFDDGSTLVMHESVVGASLPGSSFNAGANAPLFLEITQTIVGGTGRFAGASGGGTGRIDTAADAVITSSGTFTLP
ncbi:MAG TPA: hypothetical protein VFJ24_10080 [Gaiellales bacterium]|nr:hypothetical protein [Gaiellales bacterium]